MIRTFSRGAVATALAVLFAFPSTAHAAELTQVEQLYADLAKLPAAERSKKILDGAKKEGKVELLSAMYGTEWRPRELLWEKLYPDVKQALTGISSAAVAERFIAEETTGKHLTDALDFSSADAAKIIEMKLVATYVTPATDAILPKYRGFLTLFPENRWTPDSMTEHGIAYNFKEIPQAQWPHDWFDLCKPEFNGKSSYDALEPRLLIGWYTMLGEQKAKELIQCIGANKPILQTGHSERAAAMEAGDHPISGDILTYAVERFAHEQPQRNVLKIAYDAAVMADAFGASASRYAPHPYAAALYVDFTVGPESQTYMQQRYRDPIAVHHPYMPDDVKLVTFGPIDATIVDRLVGYWNAYVTKADARGK
jgi:ABC-type Fe3+ transport system substrate-binding protein